jgi:hypothetical protein
VIIYDEAGYLTKEASNLIETVKEVITPILCDAIGQGMKIEELSYLANRGVNDVIGDLVLDRILKKYEESKTSL